MKKLCLLASVLVLCLSLAIASPVFGDEPDSIASSAGTETETTTYPTDVVVPETLEMLPECV